jgi:hypothetical protein
MIRTAYVAHRRPAGPRATLGHATGGGRRRTAGRTRQWTDSAGQRRGGMIPELGFSYVPAAPANVFLGVRSDLSTLPQLGIVRMTLTAERRQRIIELKL